MRLKVVVGRQTWKDQESTDKTAPDRLGTLGLGNWENIGEVSEPAPFHIYKNKVPKHVGRKTLTADYTDPVCFDCAHIIKLTISVSVGI